MQLKSLAILPVALLSLGLCQEGTAQQPLLQRPTLFTWDGGPYDPLPPVSLRPLISDRPDFTESSSVVGLGVLQLETGYTYARKNGPEFATFHSYPEALLRVGIVAEWFEIRIGWTALQESTAGEPSDVGSDDMVVGGKTALVQQQGWLPEVAFLTELKLPTGSSEFTANEVLPKGGFIYGWEINDRWSTAGQTLLARALDDETGDPFLEVSQSWTVGRSLGDCVGAYTEWFSIMPHGADTNHVESYFNGGMTFLLFRNFQWDMRAGVGLNDAAADYFVGTGFVLRN